MLFSKRVGPEQVLPAVPAHDRFNTRVFYGTMPSAAEDRPVVEQFVVVVVVVVVLNS